jgi:hypothetical protein
MMMDTKKKQIKIVCKRIKIKTLLFAIVKDIPVFFVVVQRDIEEKTNI